MSATPCPGCGRALGDGERVYYGVCAPCRRWVGKR